ncbi:hypothetical protein T11_11615 [Trichinella zimbabwensis]|uniref:Uncharacterized protein n=1 Tax=Trichinella zimbabwensis TaxID=268475 RepID=A0A0V1HWE7_9BILA|nr:hypothetical protein T11_11615 [Trichinella zimbabwensis]
MSIDAALRYHSISVTLGYIIKLKHNNAIKVKKLHIAALNRIYVFENNKKRQKDIAIGAN